MRWTAVVLFAALLAPSVAARGSETETLTLSRTVLRKKDGTFTFSFEPPVAREARDMRTATISTQVAAEAPVALAPKAKGLKVDKWGLVAKFKKPRRTKPRVTQFVLRASGGTFVAKIAGPNRDLQALAHATFELSFGGHVYRYVYAAPTYPSPDPGTPGGPGTGPPTPAVPDGPVTFTNLYMAGAYSSGSPPSNTVLRSSTELANFTASHSFSSGTPATIPGVDFTNNMVIVVTGDPVTTNIRPWKVTMQSVTSQGGAFTVNYNKLWGPIMGDFSSPSPPSGPPWATFVLLLTVPRTTGAVSFTWTSVKSGYPWY